MGKLHEVIAAQDTRASGFKQTLADAQAAFNQPDRFKGLIESIRATAESEGRLTVPEGETRCEVAETVKNQVVKISDALKRFASLIADKEIGNTMAKADVVVGDMTLATGLPATFLLSMEDKLRTLRNTLNLIPTLDMRAKWDPTEEGSEIVQGPPEIRTMTQKRERAKVVSPASEHQQAVIHTFTEDVVVGEKTLVYLSGQWTPGRKAALLRRVDNLLDGFKAARQRANEVEVPPQFADFVVDYLFGDI